MAYVRDGAAAGVSDGSHGRGLRVGEYIRVRFRLQPPLVGSPARAQIRGKTSSKPGTKIPEKKCTIIALFAHLLEKATANKRRQTPDRRRDTAPHIEQA